MARKVFSVLAFFLVLTITSNSHAAVKAFWESPGNGMPVSGIQVIRGWTFNTVKGVYVTSLTLSVDGGSTLDIPYGGSRADVANHPAHAGYPWENMINCSFGLQLTLGEMLSAGPHTLKITAVFSNGERWEETRTVIVVKPGNIGFVSGFDLSQAVAWIDYATGEIVLDNAWLIDKLTGERKKVSGIRIKFMLDLQNPQIVGPQASGLPQSNITFEFEVGFPNPEETRTGILAMVDYLQRNGVSIDPFHVYGYVDMDMLNRDRCILKGECGTDASFSFADSLFIKTGYNACKGCAAHEVVHVFHQQSRKKFGNNLTIAWMNEGTAEAGGGWAVGGKCGTILPDQRGYSLKDLEVRTPQNRAALYTVACEAFNYMRNLAGGGDRQVWEKITSFYKNNASFPQAFQSAFGMPKEEFYASFEIVKASM